MWISTKLNFIKKLLILSDSGGIKAHFDLMKPRNKSVSAWLSINDQEHFEGSLLKWRKLSTADYKEHLDKTATEG